MRLIDADEAIINFGFEWDDIPPTREEFVRFLKKQPTVDAVPVVRCRECKHYDTADFDGNILCGCTLHTAMVDITPDSFCSYGEKKEGADNEP